MTDVRLARDVTWEVAETQHGFVITQQASEAGVTSQALPMLARRGTVERAAFGVYRFPQFPVNQYAPFMLAVLWTRADEACLSLETALAAYELCDINQNVIHIVVAKRRRLRRGNSEGCAIHH